jgi:hypothetical protein
VFEVVVHDHACRVPLRRLLQVRVDEQGDLAMEGTFAVDQAERRRADQFDVLGRRGESGVRAASRAGGRSSTTGGMMLRREVRE